jgi:GNAT superfamily N-acetyltransferase
MSAEFVAGAEATARACLVDLRTSLIVRPAKPEDAATIANLVRELAVYERLEQFATATQDDFLQHLFGPEDAVTIANLVRELAVYERLEQFATATQDDFLQHLFGPRPFAEAIMAEIEGESVGFALFFTTFSTFRGQPGLYLEDIYVKPEQRGRGVGKALLARIAKLAIDRGLGRLEWAVLTWNSPAIGFYAKLGAHPLNDWTTYRLSDGPLTELAALARP